MAKLTVIWIIIALAVRSDWEIEQTDVVGAYLNAKLKDDIFMHQLKGFKVLGKEHSILHLKRAIYGLKQSGCEWYDDLKDTLTSMGFAWCHVEHVVFHCYDQDTVILAININDIMITGDSKRGVKKFKDQLGTQYKIKDMGNLNWLLGLEVTRDQSQHTITFGQSTYIQKVVDCFNLQDADEHGCQSQHVSNSNSASIKHLSLLPSPTVSSQPTLPCSIHYLSSIICHQWQLPISSLLNYHLDFPDIQ